SQGSKRRWFSYDVAVDAEAQPAETRRNQIVEASERIHTSGDVIPSSGAAAFEVVADDCVEQCHGGSAAADAIDPPADADRVVVVVGMVLGDRAVPQRQGAQWREDAAPVAESGIAADRRILHG